MCIRDRVRCAWLGSQRYGVVLWSGDIASTFDSLRKQLKAGLNAVSYTHLGAAVANILFVMLMAVGMIYIHIVTREDEN